MLVVCITETDDGFGASVHTSEDEAESTLSDEEGYYLNTCIHDIDLSGLFANVADHRLRLALITGQDKEYARGETFKAWWADNNEGEQVAQTLPHHVYQLRENAVIAMEYTDEQLDELRAKGQTVSANDFPPDFHKQLIQYWTN